MRVSSERRQPFCFRGKFGLFDFRHLLSNTFHRYISAVLFTVLFIEVG